VIKFVFEDKDGRNHLGLGISRENVNRLIAGQPIRVRLPEMREGLSIDGAVMIYFGETERELQQAVAEFVGPETKVNIDPRLKSKLT
jgi:hypothetical protein